MMVMYVSVHNHTARHRAGNVPCIAHTRGTRANEFSYWPRCLGLGLIQVKPEPAVPVRVQDIALVPISVSYDRPAEEGALVTELSGIPKEKESLASLLAAAGSLAVGGSGRKSKRGRYVIGADIMRVGEIVTLERFLAVWKGLGKG